MQDFIPTTAPERAYIQARYLTALRAWTKGTLDLIANNYALATARYFAVVRHQLLDGNGKAATTTIEAIWAYRSKFSTADKLSVIRIICSLISEIEESNLTENLELNAWATLVEFAIALAANLGETRVGQVVALNYIKKSTSIDIIEARAKGIQIDDLKTRIDQTKSTLPPLSRTISTNPIDSEPRQKRRLKILFKRANRIPANLRTFLLFKNHALYLLNRGLVPQAGLVCEYLEQYANQLAKGTEQKEIVTEIMLSVFNHLPTETDTTLRSGKFFKSVTELLREATEDATDFEGQNPNWRPRILARYNPDDPNYKPGFPYKLLTCSCNLSDLVVARALNLLTDRLINTTSLQEQNVALSKRALWNKIYAEACDHHDVDDLAFMASRALVSKSYTEFQATLTEIKQTLELSDFDYTWLKRLRTFSNRLHHLFSALSSQETQLEPKDFITLSHIIILVAFGNRLTSIGDLTTQILELAKTKVEQSKIREVLVECWNNAQRLPILEVYDAYLAPLAAFTEQTLKPEESNECYLGFLAAFSEQNVEKELIASFFTNIVQIRVPDDITRQILSITLLTLISQQKSNEENFGISRRVFKQLLELATTKSNNIVEYAELIAAAKLLLNVEKELQKESKDTDTSRVVSSIIKKLVKEDEEDQKQTCLRLCDLIGQLSAVNIELPLTLIEAVLAFKHEMLLRGVSQLEANYPPRVVLRVIDEIIQSKSGDGLRKNGEIILKLMNIKSIIVWKLEH